ncbi:PBECR4 domain-containing protein [Cetobacterium sp.]|uniref:PBECR4 domain-containing protein n=1 Tax=Cetobacterium sp. TaxID=2071632 RepID=UPI003F37278C
MEEDKVLEQIKKCLSYYDENLCGKTFLIVFSEIDNKNLKKLDCKKKASFLLFSEIIFKDENFIHLVGIKRDKDIPAAKIYNDIKNHHIKTPKFVLSDGFHKKVDVFFKLSNLFNGKINKARYNGYKKDNLDVDRVLGTDKALEEIVLGVKAIGNNKFVPASLLKDVFSQLVEGESKKVLYILEKDNNIQIYKKLNYIDRDFKVEYLMNLNRVDFKISETLESHFNTESKKINHICYQNTYKFLESENEQLEKHFIKRGFKKRSWILKEDIEKKNWQILKKAKAIQIFKDEEQQNVIEVFNIEKIRVKK